MIIKIKGPSLPEREIEYNDAITAEEILHDFQSQMPYPIYCIALNNCYRSLSHLVYHDCSIEFLDMKSQIAWLTYQNSLVLLYLKAIHDVLGADTTISVNNSLSKGLYTTIRNKNYLESIELIEKRMHELVDEDLPIFKNRLTRKKALSLYHEIQQNDQLDLLDSAIGLQEVEAYTLANETEIFYGLLVPSTGYLKYFELRPYKNGVLLRYPHQSDPITIPEYEEQPLLYEAFSEATKWDKLMDINYAVDINKHIHSNDMKDIYMMQEALHEKKISDIADDIYNKKKRVVLICGPSSSGKTTFAKRLCIQLKVCGLQTLYLGTDDYFVNRDQTPLDENGEKDYESINAVDIELFNENINSLLNGLETDLPEYNFLEGKKIFGKRTTKIPKKTVLVIEGIHALNKLLTSGIDDNEKYKIYISPLTALNLDRTNRISTTDCRLLRRMVRDNMTRGRSVQETIACWPAVRKGEDVNIFPFHQEADVFFNSYCIYEMAVLKRYLKPLLEKVERTEPEYAEAQRLLSFLRFCDETRDDNLILNNSIIREFIGGSIIVD